MIYNPLRTDADYELFIMNQSCKARTRIINMCRPISNITVFRRLK